MDESTYYEINERLQFARVDAPMKVAVKKAAEPRVDYTIDAASVIVTAADCARWRLPKRPVSMGPASDPAGQRSLREVVTERRRWP